MPGRTWLAKRLKPTYMPQVLPEADHLSAPLRAAVRDIVPLNPASHPHSRCCLPIHSEGSRGRKGVGAPARARGKEKDN